MHKRVKMSLPVKRKYPRCLASLHTTIDLPSVNWKRLKSQRALSFIHNYLLIQQSLNVYRRSSSWVMANGRFVWGTEGKINIRVNLVDAKKKQKQTGSVWKHCTQNSDQAKGTDFNISYMSGTWWLETHRGKGGIHMHCTLTFIVTTYKHTHVH